MGRTGRLALVALLLSLAPGAARAFQCPLPESYLIPGGEVGEELQHEDENEDQPTELPPDPTLFWFSHAADLVITADGEPVPFTMTPGREEGGAQIVKVRYRGDAELVISESSREGTRELGRYRIGSPSAAPSLEPLEVSFQGTTFERGYPKDSGPYLTIQLETSRVAPVYRVIWEIGDYRGEELIPGNSDQLSFGRSDACSSFDGPLLQRGEAVSLTVTGLYNDGSETRPPEEPLRISGDQLSPNSTGTYLIWIIGSLTGACLLAAGFWMLRRRRLGST